MSQVVKKILPKKKNIYITCEDKNNRRKLPRGVEIPFRS